MPKKTAPDTLDGHAAEIWESAYASAWSAYDPDKHTGTQEEYAAKTAWAAVKQAGYKKNDDGKWVKASSSTLRLFLRFAKVRQSPAGVVTFHAQAACTELDTTGTEVLEPELFDDLAVSFERINAALEAEQPLPVYWFGQAQPPILDISHYSSFIPLDQREQARLGRITRVYRDGRYLHVDGEFDTTDIGMLAAQAVLDDEEGKIRTSVGFWPDWGNLEVVDGVTHFKGGRGHAVLDHLALTTVPRIQQTSIMAQEVTMSDETTVTLADDAVAILGDGAQELIEALDNAAHDNMRRDSMVMLSEEADNDQESPVSDAPTAEAVESVEEETAQEVVDQVDPVLDADHAEAGEAEVEDDRAESVEEAPLVEVETVAEEPVVESDVADAAPVEAEVEELAADDEPVAEAEAEAAEQPEQVVESDAQVVEADLDIVNYGPTSFDGAIEEIKARKEAWRIEDGFYLLQEVIGNIFRDPAVEDKNTAIATAMKQYEAFLSSGEELFSEATTEMDTVEEVVDAEAETEAVQVDVASEPESVVEAPPVDVGEMDPVLDVSAVAGVPGQGEPPEADPFSNLDAAAFAVTAPQGDAALTADEGYTHTPHQLGRARTFHDALTRIENAPRRGQPVGAAQSRQAVPPVPVPEPPAALPASFSEAADGNPAADLAAMVSEIVTSALAPLQQEVAALRAQIDSAPVNESAIPPVSLQRRSESGPPPVNPARVTTRAKTFGEAFERLQEQAGIRR